MFVQKKKQLIVYGSGCIRADVPGSCDGICRDPWQHKNSSSSLEQTLGSPSAERGGEKERHKELGEER